MLGICWEKYIFDVGKKFWAKKDPNWVRVRVEKIQIGKARDCPLSHHYLGHFPLLLK
tara:strand:- start:883 stop:1053 length:171 start_codon:yes stop_codon:yes gene_type:complete